MVAGQGIGLLSYADLLSWARGVDLASGWPISDSNRRAVSRSASLQSVLGNFKRVLLRRRPFSFGVARCRA